VNLFHASAVLVLITRGFALIVNKAIKKVELLVFFVLVAVLTVSFKYYYTN
jgi:hypothetical protein